jgi:hypothetical protein
MVRFHGLSPVFDKIGFRVHNIVIVRAARQPALSLGSQLVWPEYGTSQLEVGKAHMKRLVAMAIIKMAGKAILLTIIAGIVIGVVGHIGKWDTSLAYSNAFFIAGCLAIMAGASSRLGAGQEWSNYRLLYAESFRDMSNDERANFIIGASSSVSLVILGLLSGILLILISVFVTKMF